MDGLMNGVVGLSNILTILEQNSHISFILYYSCSYQNVMIIINVTENELSYLRQEGIHL